MPLPRARTALLVAGTALLARRSLRRRIKASPLWPFPALPEPISGVGRRRTGDGRELLVVERAEEADGVVRLRLEGEELPRWEPGAHVDLVLPSGAVRQYSLCGDPADRSSYTVAVRLVEDGRGGSREVHEQLHEGTAVTVRGPRNRFPLVAGRAYVFIAGGIGITPILPMLRAAEAAGVPWTLLYGGRSRATMPFLDEVEKLGAAGGSGRVRIVAEDTDGLPDPAAALAEAPRDRAVYTCGPEPLMAAVAELLPEGAELHTERFTPVAPGAGGERAFEVELRRSGRMVAVPAGQSVLAALRERALPDLPYSCQQGFCGTCRQSVVSGEVDHRDELLTDSERAGSMLICVSRACGDRLVLDL
ncbi:PDR/VanB family oxidoreductase [Streptomyces sp. XD-27]|uniref:PDR/VanB family oxidoreductase n=1 Tax=Streptomyces sp. XD-27 TaxID=3062779 RepID=UPI0026F44A28|nr:PDR/VanB family oxidoreductase [Streptomyces sp. XD-27]WKX69959.1 PDR/VanB family oxidoreductase [Streptomyces sp. XD-27]